MQYKLMREKKTTSFTFRLTSSQDQILNNMYNEVKDLEGIKNFTEFILMMTEEGFNSIKRKHQLAS